METNWKKIYTSDYLGSWDIENGVDTVVTIESFDLDTVQANQSQRSRSEVITLKFKEFNKPMIINRTNAKAITKVTGSYDMNDWIGANVTIYTKMVKAFGDEVMALRIRTIAPRPKAKPTLTDERFAKAVEAIKNGTATIEQVSKYELTEEQKTQLETLKTK